MSCTKKRCVARTKSGRHCKRLASCVLNCRNYCWQHAQDEKCKKKTVSRSTVLKSRKRKIESNFNSPHKKFTKEASRKSESTSFENQDSNLDIRPDVISKAPFVAKIVQAPAEIVKTLAGGNLKLKERYNGIPYETNEKGDICIPFPTRKNPNETIYFEVSNCAKKDCVKQFLGKPISEGTTSVVYEGCLDGDCSKNIAKVQFTKNSKEHDAVLQEAKVAALAGTKLIGPRVLKSFSCETKQLDKKKGRFHFLIMQKKGKMTMRLYRDSRKANVIAPMFNKKNDTILLSLLKEKLDKMATIGIYHTDLHPGNILIEFRKSIISSVWVIDYSPKRVKIFYDLEKGSERYLQMSRQAMEFYDKIINKVYIPMFSFFK